LKRLFLFLAVIITLNLTWAISDFEPNYVAGFVKNSDGSPVEDGFPIAVLVLSGENKDYVLEIKVGGELVDPFMKNKGYFETGDDFHFNTGDAFAVIADNGTHYGLYSGIFRLGGNGGFNTNEVLIIINQTKNLSNQEIKSGFDFKYNYNISILRGNASKTIFDFEKESLNYVEVGDNYLKKKSEVKIFYLLILLISLILIALLIKLRKSKKSK